MRGLSVLHIHATLHDLDREAERASPVHSLDGRVKILATLLMVVFAAGAHSLRDLAILEAFILILLVVARVHPAYVASRLALVLPFGGLVAILQPLIQPGQVVYSLPLGLTVTDYGLRFGALLLSRLFVSISAIILLSSTTALQDLVGSARKLGLPREFAMILALLSRYLFVFFEVYGSIRTAQKTRCFSVRGRAPYRWTLEQIAYSISTLFLRAYEQGERTYLSMLSRGFQGEPNIYYAGGKIRAHDIGYLVLVVLVVGGLIVL